MMAQGAVDHSSDLSLHGVVSADLTLNRLSHVENGATGDDTTVELLATIVAAHSPYITSIK